MPPIELRAFLDAGNHMPSAIAHAAKIELPPFVDFLKGNAEALALEDTVRVVRNDV